MTTAQINHNHVKVTANKGKRLGVMSITKLENVQLGLILQYIYKNEGVVLPESVLQFPDALDKLVSRYS